MVPVGFPCDQWASRMHWRSNWSPNVCVTVIKPPNQTAPTAATAMELWTVEPVRAIQALLGQSVSARRAKIKSVTAGKRISWLYVNSEASQHFLTRVFVWQISWRRRDVQRPRRVFLRTVCVSPVRFRARVRDVLWMWRLLLPPVPRRTLWRSETAVTRKTKKGKKTFKWTTDTQWEGYSICSRPVEC